MMDLSSLNKEVHELRREMVLLKVSLENLRRRIKKIGDTVAVCNENLKQEEHATHVDMYNLGIRIRHLEELFLKGSVQDSKTTPLGDSEMPLTVNLDSKEIEDTVAVCNENLKQEEHATHVDMYNLGIRIRHLEELFLKGSVQDSKTTPLGDSEMPLTVNLDSKEIEDSVAVCNENLKQEEHATHVDMYNLGIRIRHLEELFLKGSVQDSKTTPLDDSEMPLTVNLDSKEISNKSLVIEIPGFKKIVANACQTQNWISVKIWLETKLGKECPAWCELEPLGKHSHKNLPIVSSRCGFTGIVTVLLAHGLCVNDVVDGGEEPFVSDGYGMLHCAVVGHHTKLVKLLLMEGAKVQMKGKDGKTPLHVAAEQGQLDIVMLLVKSGSNTNVEDVKSKTPLSYAIDNKRPEVIDFLCQHK